MLDRADILALIPHQGAMCLLDHALRWSATEIVCTTRSHLAPDNPLRRAGRLGAVCGAEYAMQAAALHGALTGTHQPRGHLASLRTLDLHCTRLDDPAIGMLTVRSVLVQQQPGGMIYDFNLSDSTGRTLLAGSGTVVLPKNAGHRP